MEQEELIQLAFGRVVGVAHPHGGPGSAGFPNRHVSPPPKGPGTSVTIAPGVGNSVCDIATGVSSALRSRRLSIGVSDRRSWGNAPGDGACSCVASHRPSCNTFLPLVLVHEAGRWA